MTTAQTMPTLLDVPLAGVNVASVPQRSPFRYAGGKTWFVPYLRRWLGSLPQTPALFAEPFAGGGILSCTVLAEGLAHRVHMVERDEDVASVWQVVFGDDAARLAQQIVDFDMTEANVNRALQTAPRSHLERAFQTIVRNRVNRGGILAPGAGRLKAGENGKGLLSRWYPQTLARRIMELAPHHERVIVTHGDALDIIPSINQETTALFLDPPYTAGTKKAGSRLYRHSEVDHTALFCLTARHRGPSLMTYENEKAVRQLAEQFGFQQQAIAMKNTHHVKLTELVIGPQLGWLT